MNSRRELGQVIGLELAIHVENKTKSQKKIRNFVEEINECAMMRESGVETISFVRAISGVDKVVCPTTRSTL